MRTMILLAAGLSLAAPLGVHAQGAADPPAAQGQGQQSSQPTIRSISIVDLSELPEVARGQIDEAAKKASPSDIEGLRTSIDKSPEVTKALQAKGVTSADVIIANLDQTGVLTLITKKTG